MSYHSTNAAVFFNRLASDSYQQGRVLSLAGVAKGGELAGWQADKLESAQERKTPEPVHLAEDCIPLRNVNKIAFSFSLLTSTNTHSHSIR